MADSVAEIEGMMAARDGLAIDQNPYPEGSADALDWDAGFNYIQEGVSDGLGKTVKAA